MILDSSRLTHPQLLCETRFAKALGSIRY